MKTEHGTFTSEKAAYTSIPVARPINRRRLLQFGGGFIIVVAGGGSAYAAGGGPSSSSGTGHLHSARQEATPPAVATPQVGEQPDGTQIWHVKVGGMDMERHIDVQSFLPDEITINAGDAVWFEFNPLMPGFHTVTFTAGGEDPNLEIPDPSVSTPVAGPPTIILNPDVIFPAGGSTYDGTSYLTSGLDILFDPSMDPFVLTFTEPGSYEYMCVAHQLVMKGTVIVQDADAERPMNQVAYDQLATEQFTAIVAEGEAAIEEHADAIQTDREDGTSLWEVSAGVGGESHSRVMRFLPETVEIGIGDTVRWVDRSPGEPHTVTFLGGEETPELVTVEPQPNGAPKLIFNNMVLFPQGDGDFDGTGYRNSGFLATPITNTDTYELTFTAAGEFDYVCVLHQGMEGKIIVA